MSDNLCFQHNSHRYLSTNQLKALVYKYFALAETLTDLSKPTNLPLTLFSYRLFYGAEAPYILLSRTSWSMTNGVPGLSGPTEAGGVPDPRRPGPSRSQRRRRGSVPPRSWAQKSRTQDATGPRFPGPPRFHRGRRGPGPLRSGICDVLDLHGLTGAGRVLDR